MGGLRAAGIYCQYTLTLMRLGKGNRCFGTLRSEGRTPPGGCPQSGCPQPGSCPKTWEEVLTSHQHLTHGFSGARHFKRWCSVSNVLRQYWPKFVQRSQGFFVTLVPVEVRTAPSWTTPGSRDRALRQPSSRTAPPPQDLALMQRQPVDHLSITILRIYRQLFHGFPF